LAGAAGRKAEFQKAEIRPSNKCGRAAGCAAGGDQRALAGASCGPRLRSGCGRTELARWHLRWFRRASVAGTSFGLYWSGGAAVWF